MIWRLREQQRVRNFVWLLVHEKMLTNFCRRRRKLVENRECMWCIGGMEDTIHVIRDCTTLKEIWNFFPPSRLINDLTTMNLQEWLVKNLSLKRTVSWGGSWPKTMAIIC